MARYRYLNCSELVAVRWLASEALRWRRPRRAARARMYVTHPGRDLAPLTLAVRQWLTHCAPKPEPTPASSPAPVPATGTNPAPLRVPAPRTSPDLHTEPPTAPGAASPRAPGSGFAAALASRPRIQALREGGRSQRVSAPAAGRASARLRARTAAFRRTTHLTADRDGLWKDSLAAARIRARGLGRAA